MVDVKKVNVDEIKPNDYNPNIMAQSKFDALVHNIKEEGEMLQPILLNTENIIIDGEHRWKASKEAGLTEIWSVIVESDEEASIMKTISFNNIQGHFDPLKLNELLNKLMETNRLDSLSTMLAISKNKIRGLTELLEDDTDEDDFDDLFSRTAEANAFDIVKSKKTITCPNCGESFDHGG